MACHWLSDDPTQDIAPSWLWLSVLSVTGLMKLKGEPACIGSVPFYCKCTVLNVVFRFGGGRVASWTGVASSNSCLHLTGLGHNLTCCLVVFTYGWFVGFELGV